MSARTGNEFRVPEWSRLLREEYCWPLLAFFTVWQLYSFCIDTFCWRKFSGFRQYRLRNLSVCVSHAAVTGVAALAWAMAYPEVMLHNPMHYWSDRLAQLFLLSAAYFAHDTLYMARREWTLRSAELFLHHLATIFVFCVLLCSQKFEVYGVWAILMEVNSIFLHARTMLSLSGEDVLRPRTTLTIKALNIMTFLAFRFGVQTWQLLWVWREQRRMAHFYFCVGFYGGLFFLAINGVLFYRLLAADFSPAALQYAGTIGTICRRLLAAVNGKSARQRQ